MAYPVGFQESESQNSCMFVSLTDETPYLVAVHINQTTEQVKQLLEGSIKQNGYVLSVTSSFNNNNFGLMSAMAKMEFQGKTFAGQIVLREMPLHNTYLFFGCVPNKNAMQLLEGNLNQMALSLEIETPSQGNRNYDSKQHTLPKPKTAQEYQNFLKDKVLINYKHKRDLISMNDNRYFYGKWVQLENADKNRRFTLCGFGFGSFRFITTGNQITGDYGTFELYKFSGYWRIISENGRIYISMDDEIDGRKRQWEINDISDNIIFIESRPYEIFTQEQSGNECVQRDAMLVDYN